MLARGDATYQRLSTTPAQDLISLTLTIQSNVGSSRRSGLPMNLPGLCRGRNHSAASILQSHRVRAEIRGDPFVLGDIAGDTTLHEAHCPGQGLDTRTSFTSSCSRPAVHLRLQAAQPQLMVEFE